MTSPVLVGYFRGYAGTNGNPLNATPTSVTHVNLFVAGISSDGQSLNTNYLSKSYGSQQLIEWSSQLQSQGQQVSMSLMDSSTMHWNQVNIPAYVQSVNQVAIQQWGLNGIDIDAESGMPDDVYVATMVNLVKSMRAAIGPDKLLTYTAYTLGQKVLGGSDSNHDAEILPQIADQIDWVNTMGYFWSTSEQQTAFQAYADIVGPQKVVIGVGVDYSGGSSTPLSEVAALSSWQPSGGKAGMMLFALDGDAPQFTGQPQWSWVNTIAQNLGTGSMAQRPRAAPRPHRWLPWMEGANTQPKVQPRR